MNTVAIKTYAGTWQSDYREKAVAQYWHNCTCIISIVTGKLFSYVDYNNSW
jgi:hypothetical protein